MSASATAAVHPVLERVFASFEALPSAPAKRAAADRLRARGWPTWREEDWRYANLSAFEQCTDFRPAEAGAAPTGTLPAPINGFERCVVVDAISPLNQPTAAIRTAPMTAPWPTALPFALLTDMFASHTLDWQIHGEARIELLWLSSAGAAGRATYPRLRLALAPGARVQLIERHLAGAQAGPALVCPSTRISLAEGAELDHFRLQQCAANTLFTESLDVELAGHAHYRARQTNLGGATTRSTVELTLLGPAAQARWQALAVARGQQVHDTSLHCRHRAPGTVSDHLMRAIAEDQSRAAFSAQVDVEASAAGSQVQQSLRGLAEGPGAEIDLRPRLRIDTDDVRAQHGATSGQLDEQLLFYLLSRGIDRTSARRLLKQAFLGDVLRAFAPPSLRAQAEEAVFATPTMGSAS